MRGPAIFWIALDGGPKRRWPDIFRRPSGENVGLIFSSCSCVEQ